MQGCSNTWDFLCWFWTHSKVTFKSSHIMWGEYVTNKDNTITGILVLVEIRILVLQLNIFLILYSLFIKAVVLLFIKYECGIFSTTCIFIFLNLVCKRKYAHSFLTIFQLGDCYQYDYKPYLTQSIFHDCDPILVRLISHNT